MNAAATDLIEVHSSRLWALCHFNLTCFFCPSRIIADHLGVSTNTVLFWLTPWRSTDEHLPLSHIAQVIHIRGLIWDTVNVESSGGANPLVVHGLPKSAANYFVEHVRERMNEVGAAAPLQPR